MRSAVLQFLLAGALVVAWIWMLGRPLLTMLARRSRRDSVGHFRSQQVALGRTVGLEPSPGFLSSLLRPALDWRAQPLEQRRLQVLLGGGLATFASVLLAIALRGVYIRLFLVMAIGFTAHLLVAAWIGARELRMRDVELRRRNIDAATRRSVGRSVSVGVVEPPETLEDAEEFDDILTGDGLGGGLFDEGFFEPIPELEPQPGERTSVNAPAAETESETEYEAGDSAGEERPAQPAASDDGRGERTFTSPANPRPRPGRRPKGRPIYVEAENDDAAEGDGTVRAVND